MKDPGKDHENRKRSRKKKRKKKNRRKKNRKKGKKNGKKKNGRKTAENVEDEKNIAESEEIEHKIAERMNVESDIAESGNDVNNAEEQARRNRREARRSAFVEEVVSWIKSFVIMFAVALFLTQFIIINAVIPSGSMEDTIMTHDRLIGARFSYWFSEPERGDIVIFHYPVDEDRIYIKRVIGLPGETVRIEDGKIFINDSAEPLKEGYLKEEWDVMNTDFIFVVPADSYLMLGDNRNWSEDARYWADNAMQEGLADTWEEASDYSYVRKNKILGKAIFTYFRKFRILRHGAWYE